MLRLQSDFVLIHLRLTLIFGECRQSLVVYQINFSSRFISKPTWVTWHYHEATESNSKTEISLAQLIHCKWASIVARAFSVIFVCETRLQFSINIAWQNSNFFFFEKWTKSFLTLSKRLVLFIQICFHCCSMLFCRCLPFVHSFMVTLSQRIDNGHHKVQNHGQDKLFKNPP